MLGSKETPCEDTVGQSLTRQTAKPGSQPGPHLYLKASSLQNREKINFSCLTILSVVLCNGCPSKLTHHPFKVW